MKEITPTEDQNKQIKAVCDYIFGVIGIYLVEKIEEDNQILKNSDDVKDELIELINKDEYTEKLSWLCTKEFLREFSEKYIVMFINIWSIEYKDTLKNIANSSSESPEDIANDIAIIVDRILRIQLKMS